MSSTRNMSELDLEFMEVLREEVANREASQEEAIGEKTPRKGMFPADLRRALWSTFSLAAALAAISLSGVSGSSWIYSQSFALNNSLVVFSLLGLLILLFPGLAHILLVALQSHARK